MEEARPPDETLRSTGSCARRAASGSAWCSRRHSAERSRTSRRWRSCGRAWSLQGHLRRATLDCPPGVRRDPQELRRRARRAARSTVAGPRSRRTHELLIEQSLQRVAGLDSAAYEFQMLLGVRTDRARELVAAGHPLRMYVPYGQQWYEYSLVACRRTRRSQATSRETSPADSCPGPGAAGSRRLRIGNDDAGSLVAWPRRGDRRGTSPPVRACSISGAAAEGSCGTFRRQGWTPSAWIRARPTPPDSFGARIESRPRHRSTRPAP